MSPSIFWSPSTSPIWLPSARNSLKCRRHSSSRDTRHSGVHQYVMWKRILTAQRVDLISQCYSRWGWWRQFHRWDDFPIRPCATLPPQTHASPDIIHFLSSWHPARNGGLRCPANPPSLIPIRSPSNIRYPDSNVDTGFLRREELTRRFWRQRMIESVYLVFIQMDISCRF